LRLGKARLLYLHAIYALTLAVQKCLTVGPKCSAVVETLCSLSLLSTIPLLLHHSPAVSSSTAQCKTTSQLFSLLSRRTPLLKPSSFSRPIHLPSSLKCIEHSGTQDTHAPSEVTLEESSGSERSVRKRPGHLRMEKRRTNLVVFWLMMSLEAREIPFFD